MTDLRRIITIWISAFILFVTDTHAQDNIQEPAFVLPMKKPETETPSEVNIEDALTSKCWDKNSILPEDRNLETGIISGCWKETEIIYDEMSKGLTRDNLGSWYELPVRQVISKQLANGDIETPLQIIETSPWELNFFYWTIAEYLMVQGDYVRTIEIANRLNHEAIKQSFFGKLAHLQANRSHFNEAIKAAKLMEASVRSTPHLTKLFLQDVRDVYFFIASKQKESGDPVSAKETMRLRALLEKTPK